jgi:putative transposase
VPGAQDRSPALLPLARPAPVTDAELVEAYRANALFDAHCDDPEFGYRFLVDEAADAGEAMARADRVADLLAATAGGACSASPRSGKAKKPGPPVHDDLCAVVDEHGVIRHEFKADERTSCGSATSPSTGLNEGKLYVCAIKDVYSNRIVGYSIDSRMKSRLAVAALNNAVARRGDVAGCVVHTDRGSQFRSRKFVRALNRHAMVGSMGRVGAAGDNAAMESFFALLQKNVLNRRTWATREDLRIAIVTWIERTYHRRRRQDALGRLTPIEYESHHDHASHSGCVTQPVTRSCSSPRSKWSRDSNSGSIDWSPRELKDFYASAHRAARRDPLASQTRHIDGTCPAHAYAICECDDCGGRVRHKRVPKAQEQTKTAAELEAERQADLAALEASLQAERQAEFAGYAKEYDEVAPTEVVAKSTQKSTPKVAQKIAQQVVTPLTAPTKKAAPIGQQAKAPLKAAAIKASALKKSKTKAMSQKQAKPAPLPTRRPQ